MKAAQSAFYHYIVMFDPSLFHTFSFVSVFIASIAGSLHCVGMCGGLVGLAGSSSRGPMMGQLGYHVGRGCGYLMLGAAAGAFGDLFTSILRTLLIPSSPLGGGIALGVLATCLVCVYIWNVRRRIGVVRIADRSLWSSWRERLAKVPVALGLCTAMLPCPWLYSFVLLAAAAGNTLAGVQVMTAFWLGTVPALLVVGTIFEGAVRTMLKRFPAFSLAAVICAFAFSIMAHLAHVPAGHLGGARGHASHANH